MEKKIGALSIGLPVYNGEKFLERAIQSLLNQTVKNFELIISDNCSSDNTEYICSKYASKYKNIKYYRQLNNIGPVENFKFLLKHAEGEYFMWAPADDEWSPNWVENLLRIAIENDCLVYGPHRLIDKDGNILNNSSGDFIMNGYVGSILRRRCELFYDLNPLPIHGMFPIRKMSDKVFNQIGYIDEAGYMRYRNAGDALVLFKLLGETVIRYADGCTMYKRVHEGNSMGWGDSRKKKYIAKLLSELFSPFLTPNLWSFISLCSNSREKIALILIYPFLVLRLYIRMASYWCRKLRID